MKDICDICKREKYEHMIIQEKILNFIIEKYSEVKQRQKKREQSYVRVCHNCWKKIKTELGQKICKCPNCEFESLAPTYKDCKSVKCQKCGKPMTITRELL